MARMITALSSIRNGYLINSAGGFFAAVTLLASRSRKETTDNIQPEDPELRRSGD